MNSSELHRLQTLLSLFPSFTYNNNSLYLVRHVTSDKDLSWYALTVFAYDYVVAVAGRWCNPKRVWNQSATEA